MSRRLERGFWNGRQVKITEKEYKRIYVLREDRGGYYHRFPLEIRMDWPFPDEFSVDGRLPRKTKKALWKKFNGHPKFDTKTGVLEYRAGEGTLWSWETVVSTPGLVHKGRKP